MHIRSIRLRDWKAYVDATLDFPKPTKRRNVVLLGAMNGYGKTSLLEALVLCLFGKDGLGILARSVIRDGETDRLAQSYDDFLERAIHARAIEQGRTSASVEVSLRDEDETITIQRIWHFSGSGKHRREDEEVRIWNGPDRDLVRIPKLDDRDDFLRSFVAQTFLPVHLAQFFLFDGEQVQRLAKRDMSAQVRAGIEGMLGVPVLRELSRDLNKYAQSTRGSVKKVGDETIERLRAEVQEIEARLLAAQEELDALNPTIEPLRAKRDQIVKDLGSLHGGNYANLRELLENKGRVERERDRERERLATLLRVDLALAICGSDLRKRVAERLDAEEERAKWEHGKSQSGNGLSRLLSAFDGSSVPIDPPLTDDQATSVKERVRTAWEAVWYPPPARCADDYRHPYLASSDRALVLGRLAEVEQIALGNIRDILDQLDQYDRDLRKLESQIASQYGISDKVEAATAELERLNRELAEKESRSRELSRHIEGDRAQLAPKRQDLSRMFEGYQKAQPQLRRAALADKIADMIEGVVQESYPLHIEEVAKEMTIAYRAMAHKTLLKSVAIEPDCSVRLFGDGGRDMREMDASAGESQIFALSLIAAIGRVSQRAFPIVMDTPLARLDPAHRLNVLKHFTEKVGEQVVLLSQPDEVRGQYLDSIRDRVCVAYHLNHEELGNGVGQTKLVQGYFEEV